VKLEGRFLWEKIPNRFYTAGGAARGAGVAAAVGGMGFAVGGTEVAVTVFVGAVVGLATYGMKKVLFK